MGLTEVLSLIALVVAGLGYYENRRSNNIQLRQAVALEESNQIALGQGGVAMAAPLNVPLAFTPNRWSTLVLLVLLLMNLGVTGFDYYERHQRLTPETFHALTLWNGYQFFEVSDQHFSHETVKLDGRKFINCKFDNVTFAYEGTAPFVFDPWPPNIVGDVNIYSDINPIKFALNVCLLAAMRGPIKSTENRCPALP